MGQNRGHFYPALTSAKLRIAGVVRPVDAVKMSIPVVSDVLRMGSGSCCGDYTGNYPDVVAGRRTGKV